MKKKMKKMFSKLTVLVLLVATLVPYVNIPTVEAAAEECPEGTTPEYHTNYYFFLQAETPWAWTEALTDNGGKMSTSYYTSFIYNFPKDASTIIFEDEGFVKITKSDTVDKNFDGGESLNRKQWTAGQFYYETQALNKKSVIASLDNYAYVSDSSGTQEDRIVTYLFHGDWANLNQSTAAGSGQIVTKIDLNKLDMQEGALDNNNDNIDNLVDASILINQYESSLSNVDIGAAYVGSGKVTLDRKALQDAISNYNNFSSNPNYKPEKGGTIEYIEKFGHPVINLAIHREYKISDIFNEKLTALGYTTPDPNTKELNANINGNNGIVLKFPCDGTVGVQCTNKTAESEYIYYDNNGTDEIISIQKSIVAKKDGKNYSYFLAPTLYQMSYKVCKDSGTPIETEEVTLSYNANKPDGVTANVTGMPDNQKQEKGTEFTISDKKPELEGYKFKSWNLSEKCDSQSYEPGFKLGKLENNTPLYACWGSTDTTEPGKTGVLTYTGLFAGIIALAGGSYYLIKKKNLFKKI